MVQKIKTATFLLVLITLFLSTALMAASKKTETKKRPLRVQKIESYAGGNNEQQFGASSTALKSLPIQHKSNSAISPGVTIGNTWYDAQHNGSMGRMIDWGNNSGTSGDAIVHFSWMELPGPEFLLRHYAYNHYNADDGTFGTISAIQLSDEYGGYVQAQSANDGRVVVGGHNNPSTGNQTHLYWDIAAGSHFFTGNSRVPDSVAGFWGTGERPIWPKFAYQEGTLDVTHIFAAALFGDGIYYFRKVGADATGPWDPSPYIVDTAFDIAQSIVASKTSDKVAMAWVANLTYDASGIQLPASPANDTLSGVSPFLTQWDNDVYYQTSDDQGATWNPRVNVTKSRADEAGFRAYTDLSIMLDNTDDLHIVWSATPWAADFSNTQIDNSCKLFHYSESSDVIRTVADGLWASSNFDCSFGGWNINMSKMSVSQCDDKMYVLWVQSNDLPNGITDDCAARASSEFFGSANGELYISVSTDGGVNWDTPRNLTNSRTPGCDPANGGIDCESDNWPSMARFGRQNIAGEDWSGAVIVDPSGTYAGDYFLDVQYVHDRDAGGIVKNEGTWQLASLNWFRLACIEPTPNPQIIFTPNNIDLPIWTPPSVQLDLNLTIENIGNVGLTYTTTIEEDNGPTGWLAVSGLSGTVPSGLSNIEVGTLNLNAGGVQTTEAGLTGRVIFSSNTPTSPDTLHVSLFVVDTLVPPSIDTLIGVQSLVVSSNGNYGNMGDRRVNLDFVTNGIDCDTTAEIYLYDGSPVILTEDGIDTTVSLSMFGDGWLSPNGFKPLGGQSKGSATTFNWYSTGTFVTPDSTVAFEQTFYTPTAGGANYMLKALKVWSHDGSIHNGLRIGDAIDWDIPSDAGADNTGGFDAPRNLIYQVGTEFDQDDTLVNGTVNPAGTDCLDSDRRFGGIAFLKSTLNGFDFRTVSYGAYTASNDSFVFPTSNFVPGQLWNQMGNSGFTAETDVSDQHSVMCYEPSFDLDGNDTLVIWTALVAVYDGTTSDLSATVDSAILFFNGVSLPCNTACCQGLRGNINGSFEDCYNEGVVDISDLVYLVSFMFQGGPASSCPEEADVNASGGVVPVDVADLVFLVAYMFQGGPPPAPCF